MIDIIFLTVLMLVVGMGFSVMVYEVYQTLLKRKK